MALSLSISLSGPDLAERGGQFGQIWPSGRERGVGETDRKSGWSVVVDDGDGSVGGRRLASAATGHATTMVGVDVDAT
ncbi:hypothetical protein Scep_008160 [Stephania cephalantha]|uniref:Uncharacterized protein n=1 Tax=Stephania cephalantha TaxID=152367 RepID=A0AAP0KCY2_9MAGN